jgi:hypothetical protein
MAFGPISGEGGERRLNVLFTRARMRCEIFASFGSGDVNLERATGAGPRLLKRFLQFAETGVLEEAKPTGADFGSPFEADVAAAIGELGYQVEAQIGSAGFRTDLAVRDPGNPGRFVLAIECDGATYHSALLGARARPPAPGGAGKSRLAHQSHLKHGLVLSARRTTAQAQGGARRRARRWDKVASAAALAPAAS